MRRAGSREPEAQRIVVTRLIGRANRLTRALLRNGEDARDASQAALLTILRSTSSFRGESSVECWADRIVVRTALRLARNGRRNLTRESLEEPSPSILPGSEARLSAAQYLRRLPARQRTALVLRSCFGYGVQEIAELTQSPESTVKDRLKRARSRLRRALDHERESERARRERRLNG